MNEERCDVLKMSDKTLVTTLMLFCEVNSHELCDMAYTCDLKQELLRRLSK